MTIKKKDMKKLKHATQEEWDKLKAGYDEIVEDVRLLNKPALLLLCILGIGAIFYFTSPILSFIGLAVFAYALYVFASREGHQEGYFEAKYQTMHGGSEHADSAGHEHE